MEWEIATCSPSAMASDTKPCARHCAYDAASGTVTFTTKRHKTARVLIKQAGGGELPKRKQHRAASVGGWAKQLFVQPTQAFYEKPSVYLSAGELEIQNFRAIVAYSEQGLVVDFHKGQIEVTGDGLVIRALEKGRVSVRGLILKIEFSDL